MFSPLRTTATMHSAKSYFFTNCFGGPTSYETAKYCQKLFERNSTVLVTDC